MRYSVTLKSVTTRTVEVEGASEEEANRNAVRGNWLGCASPAVLRGWDPVVTLQLDGPWVRHVGQSWAKHDGEVLFLRFDRGAGRWFSWDEIDLLEKRIVTAGYQVFPATMRGPKLGQHYLVAVAYPDGVEKPTPEQIAAFCAPLPELTPSPEPATV